MKRIIGKKDVVMITLDTLRYDAAQSAFEAGRLQVLGSVLPQEGWEKRHSPGNFTYPAHHAFFAGFLPTPARPGVHPRPYAAQFEGATSVTEETFIFEEATLPEALAARGYRTICIGGTGFFNQRNALSSVLPGLFEEAHWDPSLGVADRDSALHQVQRAVECLSPADKRVFLFFNASAIHQPNWFYGGTGGEDTLETHTSSLVAFDAALADLFSALRERGGAYVFVFSDHGTAYGEGGYTGHRCGHEVIWTVPYAEFEL